MFTTTTVKRLRRRRNNSNSNTVGCYDEYYNQIVCYIVAGFCIMTALMMAQPNCSNNNNGVVVDGFYIIPRNAYGYNFCKQHITDMTAPNWLTVLSLSSTRNDNFGNPDNTQQQQQQRIKEPKQPRFLQAQQRQKQIQPTKYIVKETNTNSISKDSDEDNKSNKSKQRFIGNDATSFHSRKPFDSTTRRSTSSVSGRVNFPKSTSTGSKSSRSSTSIDELEQKLFKRFEQQQQQYDDDDDNYDNNYSNNNNLKSKLLTKRATKTSTTTTKSSSSFRAKPVRDTYFFDQPKEKQVQQQPKFTPRQNEQQQQRLYEEPPSQILDRKFEKKSQYTPIEQPRKTFFSTPSANDNNNNDNDDNDSSFINNDYDNGGNYRNDRKYEKGYSNLDQSTQTQNYVSTTNRSPTEQRIMKQKQQQTPQPPALPKRTFFFSDGPSSSFEDELYNDEEEIEEQEQVQIDNSSKQRRQQQQRQISESIPLYNDEDGTPMYLTINQALQNYKNSNYYQENIMQQSSTSTPVREAIEPDNDENREYIKASSTTSTSTVAAESEESESIQNQSKLKSWEDVGITHPILLRNLRSKKLSCQQPLAVQKQSCQAILLQEPSTDKNTNNNSNDVVIGTYTGSGKTLAFLVPTIQRLLNDEMLASKKSASYLKVLIIAPGRELASQIVAVVRDLIQDISELDVVLAIGGTTYTRNLETIRKRKPSIIVGTPGRIAELILGQPENSSDGSGNRKQQQSSTSTNNGRVKISSLQTVVLDEFDALLQYKPHSDPTQAILTSILKQRQNNVQTIYCSATATDMIMTSSSPTGSRKIALSNSHELLQQYLRPNYKLVKDDSSTKMNSLSNIVTSPAIIHGVIHVEHKRYVLETVRKILYTNPPPEQVLLFVDTAHKVDIIVKQLLERYNIIAAPFHGGTTSTKDDRTYINTAFRTGKIGIVVATELAARGIDAPLLTHVINIDLPTDSSHYAHRAGRCGRTRSTDTTGSSSDTTTGSDSNNNNNDSVPLMQQHRPGVVISLTTSPAERNVPIKLTKELNVPLYTVEVKNGKLNIIDSSS
jgi:superfamily II DNA/RNA helicase